MSTSKADVKKDARKMGKENDANLLRKRSARFSQLETDLLCSLVVANGLNTNVTNKLTKNGRLADWNYIATMFNASPGVSYRPVNVLKERAHNIRKDLNKLATFTLATGGDHLPPKNPPKVSFKLSDAVKQYATQLKMNLTGLEATCSDAAISQFGASSESDTENLPSPKRGQNRNSTSAGQIQIESTPMSPIMTCSTAAAFTAVPSASQTTTSASTIDVSSISTGNAGNLFTHSTQFFAKQNQRKRKRSNDRVGMPVARHDSSSHSSSHSSEISQEKYYSKKNALIDKEEARRAEWHTICMDIKKEQLAMKRKQSQFWDVAMSVLRSSTVTIADIANAATSIQGYESPIESCNDYPALNEDIIFMEDYEQQTSEAEIATDDKSC